MATAADPTGPTTWCLFQCDSRPYAVPLGSVVEVVRFDRLVRLPLGPPWLVGLCTLRRDVIPVFWPPGAGPGKYRAGVGSWLVLVLRAERGTFGMLIDRTGVHVHEGERDAVGDGAPPGPAAGLSRGGVAHAVIDPEVSWQGLQTEIGSWYQCKTAGAPAATS